MELPDPSWTDQQFADYYHASRRTIIRWRQAGFDLLDPFDVQDRIITQHSTRFDVMERVCSICDQLKAAAR